MEKTFTLGCFPINETETDYVTLLHTSNTAIYLAQLQFVTQDKQDILLVNFLSVYNNYGNYQSQITLKGNLDANAFVEVYKNPDKQEYLFAVYKFNTETIARIHHQAPPLKAGALISEPLNGSLTFSYVLKQDFNENYEFYQDYDNKWHVILVDPQNYTLQGAKITPFPVLTVFSNITKEQTIRYIA